MERVTKESYDIASNVRLVKKFNREAQIEHTVKYTASNSAFEEVAAFGLKPPFTATTFQTARGCWRCTSPCVQSSGVPNNPE